MQHRSKTFGNNNCPSTPQVTFPMVSPSNDHAIKYLQQLLTQNERTLVQGKTLEQNNKMNIPSPVCELSPNKFVCYSNGSARQQVLFSKRQPQQGVTVNQDVKCTVHCSKGNLWIDMDEEAMFLLYQQYRNTK